MSPHDQRKSQRFELRLPIELVRSGDAVLGKISETRNLSSAGVMFTSEAQLPVGGPIEYFITLPGENGRPRVKLHCVGTVVRLEARQIRTQKDKERPFNVAATLERYEFVRGS